MSIAVDTMFEEESHRCSECGDDLNEYERASGVTMCTNCRRYFYGEEPDMAGFYEAMKRELRKEMNDERQERPLRSKKTKKSCKPYRKLRVRRTK